jgi:AcrR family transcriptional regulator
MVYPRQDRRWTRRKKARPAELISAALDLFVERGFSATRLEDVAARAGVSKGTLYLYFPSKEDLFKAVVRGGIVPAIERAEKLLDEHRGSADLLIRDMVKGWWVSVGNTQLGGIPKLMISESRNFPELAQFYFHEVISRVHRLVAAAVQRGIDNGEFRPVNVDYVKRLVIAPLWLLTVWRFSFDYCETHKLDPSTYLDSHLDLILRGLANDETVRWNGAEAMRMKSGGPDSICVKNGRGVAGALHDTGNAEKTGKQESRHG